MRLAAARLFMGVFPPFTFNQARRLVLKACGIRIGRATMFWGMPELRGPGPIASRLQVGSNCGFNDGCHFDLQAPVAIGNHVAVGHEVRFMTGQRPDGSGTAAPITVEDGAWLGARCTILGGVTIGAGSVIGAGITVAADVPANMLVTGGKPISLAKWR